MLISRSEQKRRVKEVEHLIAELITLPSHVLDQASLPEEFRPLIREAAKLSGSARQRQVKYITKLAQEFSLETLYALVSRHHGKALTERKQQHEIEFYRDALINEALEQQEACRQAREEWAENWVSATLAELKQRMPEIDVPSLARLAYLFARTRNPRHSREIFRQLRSIQELRQRKEKQAGQQD